MSTPLVSNLDCGGAARIKNLGQASANGEPVVFEQLASAIEGIAWKDSVRVASVANVTISSPGTAIDGVTLTAGDRVLLKNQTTASQNGIYIFNGSATPMTRSLDASTFAELEAARVPVEEGTNANTEWRQTQVNGTIDSSTVTWAAMGSSAPAASETTAGVLEIATQAETDAGTDDARAMTPLKFASSSLRLKKYSATIGDGSTTSIAVTHSLGTADVQVYVYEVGGSKREVFVEKQHTSTTVVTLVFDVAPASNSLRVVVIG